MLCRVFIALLAMSGTALAYTRCDTKTIGGPGASVAEEGSNPVITAGGKYIYAGFMQSKNLSVAVSADWGKTLGAPVTVYNGAGLQHLLRLAASGAHVYALWTVQSQGQHILMFAASDAHGASGSWTVSSFGPFLANLPQIAADGRGVHIVYHAIDGNMVVRSSEDYGQKFADPVVLGKGAAEPVVAAAGGHVYASWSIGGSRADTMLAVSHDRGKTFKVTEPSANRPSGSNEPILAVDTSGGRVSLIWRETSPWQGVYLQSLDHGDSWSAPLIIDTDSKEFMVSDDGTYLYVTYLKNFRANNRADWQISLAISKDGGKTFQSSKNLSGPTGVEKLNDDDQRPIPWVWNGNGAFRVTGVEGDGIHIWNGRNGIVFPSSEAYLGPGVRAAPALNSVVWQSPNQFVSYGYCH